MTTDWLVRKHDTPSDHLTKTFPNPAPKAPTTHLPPKKHVHEDGTITAPNWNPPDATESQVTRSATRSYEDTLDHPNPFGDPPDANTLYKPAKFQRAPEPEPTVTFTPEGRKVITFDEKPPSTPDARNAKPVAPGERPPTRRVVGPRTVKRG